MSTEFSACNFAPSVGRIFHSLAPASYFKLSFALLYASLRCWERNGVTSCSEVAPRAVHQGSPGEGDRVILGSHCSYAGLAGMTTVMHKDTHKPDKYAH